MRNPVSRILHRLAWWLVKLAYAIQGEKAGEMIVTTEWQSVKGSQ
jgi:hypothetical protein